MQEGRQRGIRTQVYFQAAMVWGLKKIDAKSWITRGTVAQIGEPVVLKPEQEQSVNEYVKRIEKEGRFVMPE